MIASGKMDRIDRWAAGQTPHTNFYDFLCVFAALRLCVCSVFYLYPRVRGEDTNSNAEPQRRRDAKKELWVTLRFPTCDMEAL
jgi:hypothetical protein